MTSSLCHGVNKVCKNHVVKLSKLAFLVCQAIFQKIIVIFSVVLDCYTCTELLAELLQLGNVEVLNVHGEIDSVQQGRWGALLLPVCQLILRNGVPVRREVFLGGKGSLLRCTPVRPALLGQGHSCTTKTAESCI